MKSQITFTINNQPYSLDAAFVRTTDWNRNPITPVIYAEPKVAGKLVKQFIKNNYPKLLCRVKSESFANGNSLTVYVTNQDGSPVADSIYSAINRFAHQFEYGYFDGMNDIYEHREDSGLTTDGGMKIEAGVKYVNTESRPMFDTLEWVIAEVTNGRDLDNALRYLSPATIKKAEQFYKV